MVDIRQSVMYGEYIRRIGWVMEKIGNTQIFIKRLPLIGSIIKIQRSDKTPQVEAIDKLAKKYRAWSVSIEMKNVLSIKYYVSNKFTINKNPYLSTKTIHIDLTSSEEKVFGRFAEAKRRAVRRAVKNGIVVKESDDVESFIKLKAKDFWPLAWLMAKDVRALWESFRPKNAMVLVAYSSNEVRSSRYRSNNRNPIAGILLLFFDGIAYYWMAVATNEGKKLFAPTLLVWEALRLAKKKGCTIFDFEGVYDERFHNATKKWKGFTKFKEGFGGKEVVFPNPLVRHYRKAF